MTSHNLGACLHPLRPVSLTTRDDKVHLGRRFGPHRIFSLIGPVLGVAAMVGPSAVLAATDQALRGAEGSQTVQQALKPKVVNGWKFHPKTQAGMKAVEEQLTAVLVAIKKENDKCACVIGPRPRLDADVAALLKEVSAINRGQ